MNWHVPVLATVLVSGLFSSAALASPHQHPVPKASADDPYAPVFIVTSAQTYETTLTKALQGVANVGALRDSVGTRLVVLESRAGQLGGIAQAIHHGEDRCGGFHAFKSREQAEAFIRADQSRAALARNVDYSIDQGVLVNSWLTQISEAQIKSTIEHMASYPNRHATTTTGRDTAVWVKNKWTSLAQGRSDVSTELTAVCAGCGVQPSVIMTVRGTHWPNEIVVVGAHMDSISNSGTGANMKAPGADDNASGVAVVTETIRIALSNGWSPKRTVMFMAYAAEETGLNGSRAIAQSFKAAGKNVVGVVNMDMTNYRKAGAQEMSLVTDYTNPAQNTFMKQLFAAYLPGARLGGRDCGYACSDHASWTQEGFVASRIAEAVMFSQLHTVGDTLAAQGNVAVNTIPFAKMSLAYVAELAKTGGDAPNGLPTAQFSFAAKDLTVTFKDESRDPDGQIVKRSWDFGDGTSSADANPVKAYAKAGAYAVTLLVTDDKGATAKVTRTVDVAAPTDTALENGKPVSDVSGAVGSERVWTYAYAGQANAPQFSIKGGTGDADLYVKFGSAPTPSSYDCRPYKAGNDEVCEGDSARQGTYYVMVRGYREFSGVTVLASHGSQAPVEFENEDDVILDDGGTVESRIVVTGQNRNGPVAAKVSVVIKHTYIGDLVVDLVSPKGTAYNLHNRSGGSTDNLISDYTVDLSSEPLDGEWRLRVRDAARGDTGLIDRWSLRF